MTSHTPGRLSLAVGLVFSVSLLALPASASDCCTHGNLCHKCDLPICIPSGPPFGYNPTIWNRWPIEIIDEHVIESEVVAPGNQPAPAPPKPTTPAVPAPLAAPLAPPAPQTPPAPSVSPSDELEPSEPGVREEPDANVPNESSSWKVHRPLTGIAHGVVAPLPITIESEYQAAPVTASDLIGAVPARDIAPAMEEAASDATGPFADDAGLEGEELAAEEIVEEPTEQATAAEEVDVPVRKPVSARTAGRTPVVVPVDVDPTRPATAQAKPRRQRFFIFARSGKSDATASKNKVTGESGAITLFGRKSDSRGHDEGHIRQASATSIGSLLKPIVEKKRTR